MKALIVLLEKFMQQLIDYLLNCIVQCRRSAVSRTC